MANGSSSGVAHGQEFVVRRPLMVGFGVVAVPIIWLVGVVVTFSSEMAAHGWGNVFVGSLVLSGLQVFFWSLSWRSSIHVGLGGLKVRNFFLVTEVPWSMVREIVLADGLEIVLKDGSVVSSIHFGGSVIGAITGFPTYRQAVLKLQEAHRRYLESHPDHSVGEQWGCSVRLVLPFVDFAVFYVLLLVPFSVSTLTL